MHRLLLGSLTSELENRTIAAYDIHVVEIGGSSGTICRALKKKSFFTMQILTDKMDETSSLPQLKTEFWAEAT